MEKRPRWLVETWADGKVSITEDHGGNVVAWMEESGVDGEVVAEEIVQAHNERPDVEVD